MVCIDVLYLELPLWHCLVVSYTEPKD